MDVATYMVQEFGPGSMNTPPVAWFSSQDDTSSDIATLLNQMKLQDTHQLARGVLHVQRSIPVQPKAKWLGVCIRDLATIIQTLGEVVRCHPTLRVTDDNTIESFTILRFQTGLIVEYGLVSDPEAIKPGLRIDAGVKGATMIYDSLTQSDGVTTLVPQCAVLPDALVSAIMPIYPQLVEFWKGVEIA